MNIFPTELVRAIECLGDENRRKIVSSLTERPMAYTEIKNALQFTNGNFNHHLIELTKAGLITRYLGTECAGPYEKYYSLSEFGKDFVKGIFNALTPSPSKQQMVNDYQIRFFDIMREGLGAAQVRTEPLVSTSVVAKTNPGMMVGMYGR